MEQKTFTGKGQVPVGTRHPSALPGASKFALPRAVTKNVDDIIPGMDSQYLEFFLWQYRRCFYRSYDDAKRSVPAFDISSDPTRAAILVFASSMKEPDRTDSTLKYFDAFCSYSKTALKNNDFLDLVCASYYIALAGLFHPTLINDASSMTVHYLQFCRIAEAISSPSHGIRLPNETLASIKDLLQTIISMSWSVCMRYCYRSPANYAQIWEPLWEIIDLSSSVMSRGPPIENNAVVNTGLYLEVYSRIKFLRFLDLANQKDGEVEAGQLDTVRAQLVQILWQLIELAGSIPSVGELLRQAYDIDSHIRNGNADETHGHLPFPPLVLPTVGDCHRPDVEIAYLYCNARLLASLLAPDADHDMGCRKGAFESAIAICRILHETGVRNWWISQRARRSYFWAGLIVTRDNYAPGKFRVIIGLL